MHIAHLNNDIFLDLVTVDYGTDSITIFSGDGTGNLSYRMRYSTGYDSSPVSVISADLNDDHFLDMSVGNCGPAPTMQFSIPQTTLPSIIVFRLKSIDATYSIPSFDFVFLTAN